MSRLGSVTREDNKQDQFGYYRDGELNWVLDGTSPTPSPSPTPTPPPGSPTPTAPPGSPTPTPPGGQVATPTFAPGGGTYCAHSLSVTISTTTSNAQMRYTTDGTMPTSGANGHGTLINGSSGTITVSGIGVTGVNLQAIAYKSGMTDSAVRSDWYYYDCGQGPTKEETTVDDLLSLPEGMDPESL